MKNLLFFLLIYSFLSTLQACKKIQNKYFDTKISGKVFDFYTRKPLANATVVFGKLQESDFYIAYDSATTDEQGYYEIKSEEKYLEEGWNSVYIVSAKKTGYEITFADKAFDDFDGFYKKVEGSKKNKNVNLYLRKEIKVKINLFDVSPYLNFNRNQHACYLASSEKNRAFIVYPGYHKTLSPIDTQNYKLSFFETLNSIEFNVPLKSYFVEIYETDSIFDYHYLFSQKFNFVLGTNEVEVLL